MGGDSGEAMGVSTEVGEALEDRGFVEDRVSEAVPLQDFSLGGRDLGMARIRGHSEGHGAAGRFCAF